jgi:hypothetical protein
MAANNCDFAGRSALFIFIRTQQSAALSFVVTVTAKQNIEEEHTDGPPEKL